MRQDILRDKAITLQTSLQKYAVQSTQAEDALRSLSALLNRAVSGKITEKVDWDDVPCSYMFLDGELGGFKDLSAAYSDFKVEVTGSYDSPVFDVIREIIDQKN